MTTPIERRIQCSNPIDADLLMDYWLAALPSATEEAVEEHLLTCGFCGDRLRETMALAESLKMLARSGSLQVIISDQFLKHATEMGQRVREYIPPGGGRVQCTVAADDDFLVGRLAADLSSVRGPELMRRPGSRVSPDGRHPRGRRRRYLICQQSITIAKASPSNPREVAFLPQRLIWIGSHSVFSRQTLKNTTRSSSGTMTGRLNYSLEASPGVIRRVHK